MIDNICKKCRGCVMVKMNGHIWYECRAGLPSIDLDTHRRVWPRVEPNEVGCLEFETLYEGEGMLVIDVVLKLAYNIVEIDTQNV
jgi:hypothetical protein